jgi:hypothetical protein
MMTRKITALLLITVMICFVAWDLAASEPVNPFQAPPLLALGSGLAAGGAHCAALPSR